VTQLESHSPRRSRREAERNRAAYGAGPVTPEYPPSAPDHRMPRGTDRGVPPAPPTPPRGRVARPVPPGGGRPQAPDADVRARQAPQAPGRGQNPAGPYPAQGYAAPQSRREAYPQQQQPMSRRDSREARGPRTSRAEATAAYPPQQAYVPQGRRAAQAAAPGRMADARTAPPPPGRRPPGRTPYDTAPRRARTPLPSEDPRRGSHATPLGQSFGWVVGWTILGTIIPGTGLIAAGMRRLGAALLVLLGIGSLMLAAAAFVGDPVKRVTGLAVHPEKLLILAMLTAVIATAWVGLVLLTNSRLRQYARLTGVQQGFTTLLVLALVAGIVVPAYKVASYAMIQRDLVNSVFASGERNGPAPDAGAADPWAKFPRVNVMLVGSDAGPSRTGIRPDTLILASIDTKSGNTVMFSLPRNLERVPFKSGSPGAEAFPDGYFCPDHSCLLNAVWQWGEQNKSKFDDPDQAGLQATKDAVEGVLDLPVDYYAMVNLQGFQDFVDAIGGVTVDVKERLPIGGNSKNRRADGYIEVGDNQKLNGFKALWFARSRWSTDDFDRMRRQRCVMGAAADQADPVKLALNFPKLARAAKNNMQTDIPQNELQAWVELATRIKGAKVRSLPFDNKVVTSRSDPDYPAIQEMVQNALKPAEKKEKSTTPSTDPSASASTPATEKPKKPTEPVDPTKAQDVNDVC
jgi:LCP family protein required for cell wall assembly